MSTKYETVIGLEIHAELATKTKLFCACKNDPFRAPEPNLYICPVCLALPGTLPVMNRQAVEWSVLVGLALGCEIGWPLAADSLPTTAGRSEIGNSPTTHNLQPTTYTKWDRKNYFYPDLPKGYQISQYDLPIVHRGGLEVSSHSPAGESVVKRIEITRIHLEEDTGKLVHPPSPKASEGNVPRGSYSLIDYNRAGVPLLELVTEPVIRTAAEAASFAQLYQLVLRTLGVANADMEKGEMRVEANISVRPIGLSEFGTKVEVKNLNSFKSVQKAIEYETTRQIDVIESGGTLVQETRGWDEAKQQTYTQRVKETAAQYRYFPEPDLPPVTMAPEPVQKLLSIGLDKQRSGYGIDPHYLNLQLPELPWEKRARYIEAGVAETDTERLIFDLERSKYFDAANANNLPARALVNWILNDLPDQQINPSYLTELNHLLAEGVVNSKIAKDLLAKMRSTGQSPRAIIEHEGLAIVQDDAALGGFVTEVLAANPQAVTDYQAGKPQALGFLLGQVMAKSRGQANPQAVRKLLEQELGK